MDHITIALKLIDSLIGGRGQAVKLSQLRRELKSAQEAQLDQDGKQNEGLSMLQARMREMERFQKVLGEQIADLQRSMADELEELKGTLEGEE